MIMGGFGSDTIYGESGQDMMFGDGFIMDRVVSYLPSGLPDNEIVNFRTNFAFETGGYDEIYGSDGNDFLVGGLGPDMLYGDATEDLIGPDSAALKLIASYQSAIEGLQGTQYPGAVTLITESLDLPSYGSKEGIFDSKESVGKSSFKKNFTKSEWFQESRSSGLTNEREMIGRTVKILTGFDMMESDFSSLKNEAQESSDMLMEFLLSSDQLTNISSLMEFNVDKELMVSQTADRFKQHHFQKVGAVMSISQLYFAQKMIATILTEALPAIQNSEEQLQPEKNPTVSQSQWSDEKLIAA